MYPTNPHRYNTTRPEQVTLSARTRECRHRMSVIQTAANRLMEIVPAETAPSQLPPVLQATVTAPETAMHVAVGSESAPVSNVVELTPPAPEVPAAESVSSEPNLAAIRETIAALTGER